MAVQVLNETYGLLCQSVEEKLANRGARILGEITDYLIKVSTQVVAEEENQHSTGLSHPANVRTVATTRGREANSHPIEPRHRAKVSKQWLPREIKSELTCYRIKPSGKG